MSEQTTTIPTQNDTEKVGIDLANSPELKDLFSSGQLEKMDKMKASPLNIASQYYDFEMNKPVRFAFLGITEQPTADTGELLPAVALIDKQGNTYTNMATILVSTFVNQKMRVGTFVEITWIGQKKTGNGFTVRTWSVKPLSL